MINLKRQIPPKMCILLNKQGEKLQLTASSDLDLSLRSSAVGSERLNLLHDVHSVNYLTEHNVMSIQMRSGDLPITRDTHSYGGNEELRTVGVGTRVRHGKQSSSVVTHNEALISELGSVDGLASVAIEVLPLTCPTHAYRNISSLEHESGNHSVEDRVLVAKILTLSSLSLLSGAEGTEVLGSLGNDISAQLPMKMKTKCHLKDNATHVLSIGREVHVHQWVLRASGKSTEDTRRHSSRRRSEFRESKHRCSE